MSKDKNLNEKLEDIYSNLKDFGTTVTSSIAGQLGEIKFGLSVKYVNKSNNPDLEYATVGSSGFDLRANLEDGPIVLSSLERKLIPTGLFFAIPQFHELQVRPRSGLALKNGITVLNTPGTVDSDYRGEVGIILINLSNYPFTINHGDRIAQGVIMKSEGGDYYNLTKTDELDQTERNNGGFGSTGVK